MNSYRSVLRGVSSSGCYTFSQYSSRTETRPPSSSICPPGPKTSYLPPPWMWKRTILNTGVQNIRQRSNLKLNIIIGLFQIWLCIMASRTLHIVSRKQVQISQQQNVGTATHLQGRQVIKSRAQMNQRVMMENVPWKPWGRVLVREVEKETRTCSPEYRLYHCGPV